MIDSLKGKWDFKAAEASIEEPLNQFGYRGLHITLDMGDGISGEIQLHTRGSEKIKKITEIIYRDYRNWTKKDIEALPPEELHKYRTDMKRSNDLWKNYWDTIDPSVKAAASSAVKGLESDITPTLTFPPSTQTPSLKSKGTLPESSGLKSITEPLNGSTIFKFSGRMGAGENPQRYSSCGEQHT
ncbi:MAG: hypothetical protein NTW44_03705 [Nitrospirae bacterium]|nr:hypothetical protein [Nitrospirota bacterium]